jgi:hypothetical protein
VGLVGTWERPLLAETKRCGYTGEVLRLTKMEQRVLLIVAGLLLLGLTVKVYRTGHSATPKLNSPVSQQAGP